MLIESEELKKWLEPIIQKNIIHFACGDYIMHSGQPYYEMYQYVKECEKKMERERNVDEDTKR